MDFTELNSFIFKFNQLWHSGMSAHLDLDTHAGEAWVGLRVRLGQAPFPPQEAFSNLLRTRKDKTAPSCKMSSSKRTRTKCNSS